MTAPQKVGVIGAGTMGAGIAQKVAQSGIDVVLMDIGQKQIQAGLDRIRTMLDQGVERKVFRAEQRNMILGHIVSTTHIQDLADCDLVVEAVFEDLQIKQKLFAELEQYLRPDAVLATNTSSFKVSAVCKGAQHPADGLALERGCQVGPSLASVGRTKPEYKGR